MCIRDRTAADVLVEINMAGEESKFGILPEQAEEFIRELANLGNIRAVSYTHLIVCEIAA